MKLEHNDQTASEEKWVICGHTKCYKLSSKENLRKYFFCVWNKLNLIKSYLPVIISCFTLNFLCVLITNIRPCWFFSDFRFEKNKRMLYWSFLFQDNLEHKPVDTRWSLKCSEHEPPVLWLNLLILLVFKANISSSRVQSSWTRY